MVGLTQYIFTAFLDFLWLFFDWRNGMNFRKHPEFIFLFVVLWGITQASGILHTDTIVTSASRSSRTPTKIAVTASPSGACVSYNQLFETRVLELVNQERAKLKLPALKAQSQLAAAARAHSADMACSNYFSHTGLNGSTAASRITQQGYKWSAMGENIAAGSSTPEGVVQQWMNSAPHKANILSPNYTDIGVGYAYSSASTYKHYWTLDFAKP
jgi:uncharacterized protein YkwD